MSIFHQRIFPSPIVGINKKRGRRLLEGRAEDDIPVVARTHGGTGSRLDKHRVQIEI